MPPLPLVYLIVDPLPFRPTVVQSRLILLPQLDPFILCDLDPAALTPAGIRRLQAEGAVQPAEPFESRPQPLRWLRLA